MHHGATLEAPGDATPAKSGRQLPEYLQFCFRLFVMRNVDHFPAYWCWQVTVDPPPSRKVNCLKIHRALTECV